MGLFHQIVCLSEMIAIHLQRTLAACRVCHLSLQGTTPVFRKPKVNRISGIIFQLITTTNNDIGFGHYALPLERRCTVCVFAGPD